MIDAQPIRLLIDLALLCTAAAWLAHSLLSLRGVRAIPQLQPPDLGATPGATPQPKAVECSSPPTNDPTSPPTVAVLLAARDEASRIGETVRRLCAQRGVDLRIIIVDDRSVDGTGDAARAAAQNDPRVQVLRVNDLPEGWLGKCHALHVGAQHVADAEWLLFTDADAWMHETVIARAVAHAQREDAHHLCLMPGFHETTRWGRAAVLCAALGYLQRAAFTHRDAGRGAIGVGAFNLVRADAYRAIGGHEPLRMEVLDDVKLAMLVRAHAPKVAPGSAPRGGGNSGGGGRSRVAFATSDVEVEWGGSALGLVRILEKNFFALFHYNLPLALLVIFGGLGAWALALVGPLLSPVFGALALGAMALSIAPAAIVARAHRWSVLDAIISPLAAPVLLLAAANSTIRTLRDGGVRWRGVLYPLRELRSGVVRWPR
ncbi:MAG: glycosyltransferase [Phycisphaerales bacterium]|nr:MAG: glycosyltransferase [Phycisphaerales bacterium]